MLIGHPSATLTAKIVDLSRPGTRTVRVAQDSWRVALSILDAMVGIADEVKETYGTEIPELIRKDGQAYWGHEKDQDFYRQYNQVAQEFSL